MNSYTTPDFSTAALITIDTQCDTLDGQPLEIPGTSAALPNMKKLTASFRDQKKPIVHIVRIYKKDGSNADLCRKEAIEGGRLMLTEGTSGCQLAQEILPSKLELDAQSLLAGKIQTIKDQEVIIYKPRWGAFYRTPLESHLQKLKITTLVFSGCNFPNCPRTSIYEASERDYKVVLVTDAISGLYEKGMQELKNIGTHLMRTDELISQLSS